LAPGPLGSVAGDPDRHRGWLLCPSSVPAAAGRVLRPRVFPAHRPAPKPKETMCLTESDPDHKVTKFRETPHQIT
jgi:hypothetical protein